MCKYGQLAAGIYMSLVFCVSIHVQWCEVRQQRVETKISGEDTSVLVADFLWFVLAPQGQSQDMTEKVTLVPSTTLSSLSNIVPSTQSKKQLRESVNKLKVNLKCNMFIIAPCILKIHLLSHTNKCTH
jgi:hypothetical protein